MILFFPEALILIAEAFTASKRIKEFLLQGILINKSELSKRRFVNENPIFNGVIMKNATALWTLSDDKSGIKDFNIDVLEQSLVAVVGPVGSGEYFFVFVGVIL